MKMRSCEPSKKSSKPQITLKKEFSDKYLDYSKEELLFELAETKGKVKALKENHR